MRKKILVVEDNKDLSSILIKMLELNEFSVDLVEDGDAMLGHLKTGKEPEAIILDLTLPGRSGFDLLCTINSIWPAARIYIFTGRSEYHEKHGLKSYNIAGFFSKSEGGNKLIEAIKEEIG
jgi:DNA-binding response OmpR family regulator